MSKPSDHSRHNPLRRDELEDLDRASREEAVADAVAAAKALRLPVDLRCEDLLQRYIDGEISDTQLVAEIKRPYLN